MKMELAKVKDALCALLFLLGLAGFTYGLWLAWRPLAFMIGGVVLAAIAFFLGYDREKVRSGR